MRISDWSSDVCSSDLQFQIFKSVVGEAAEIQFSESLLPGASTQPRHFIIGSEAYFIGELAEAQSRGRGFTLDQTQFLAIYAKTLALAALTPFADSGELVDRKSTRLYSSH